MTTCHVLSSTKRTRTTSEALGKLKWLKFQPTAVNRALRIDLNAFTIVHVSEIDRGASERLRSIEMRPDLQKLFKTRDVFGEKFLLPNAGI